MVTALMPSMVTAQPHLDLTRLIPETRFDPWLPSRPARMFRHRIITAEYATGTIAGVLASGNVDRLALLQPAGSHPFFGLKITGVYTDAQFLLQLQWHVGAGRHYATKRVPAICLLGTGRFPMVLPVPIQLNPGGRMRVTATDDGFAADNTIRLSLHGAEVAPPAAPFHPARRYRAVTVGAIAWDFATTSAAHSEPDTGIPAASLPTGAPRLIDPDYDFEGVAMTIQAVGDFLLDFRMSSGEHLYDRAVHGASLGATRFDAAIKSVEAPYLFPIGGEFFVPGGTTVYAEVTDLTGAATNAIQIVIHGRLLIK